MEPYTNTTNSDDLGTPPVYDDIQGLLINGYRGYNFIRFLIFTIPTDNIEKERIASVRQFCGALIPGTPGSPLTITPATRLSDVNTLPAYKLNMGLTQTGLTKLITLDNYETVLNDSSEFLDTFNSGAAAAAGIVGDTGTSDPQNWWQGDGWILPEPYSANTPDLDLLLCIYAASPEDRNALHKKLMKMMGENSAVLAFQKDSDPLDPVGQKIHFGYRDGISQPRINGFDETSPELDDRPLVDSWHFIINLAAGSSSFPPNYFAHPLLNNGSFGAFRVLSQDVERFENFINESGEDAELIAAKMCGRWRDGTPIEVSPLKPLHKHLLGQSLSSEYQLNNFNYISPSANQEPKPAPLGNHDFGKACPYAAHVRRANPRDDPSVSGNTDINGNVIFASQNRVLRRARPYGPPYIPGSEIVENQDRGLIGLFIGADIGAQFEFIMQKWITKTGFSSKDNSPNKSGYDPLFGSPDGDTEEFSYCKEGQDPENPHPGDSTNYEIIGNLPQFITTKGGLYVFLPSITALQYLASGTIPTDTD